MRHFVLAAVILHNFLQPLPEADEDLPMQFPDDRRILVDQRAPEAGRIGRRIREQFVDVVIGGLLDE